MKLSKRWNRVFSVVITAILVASLLITYPAFNVTKANNTIPTTTELTYNETLAMIYVDTGNVSYVGDNRLVTEFNAASGVYYWNGSGFVEVTNKGIFFIVKAKQDIEVNVSSTDNIQLSLSDSGYQNTLVFSLSEDQTQEIYVDVSSVSGPSFGVITFVFTNASGYHETHSYEVYVTQALTSSEIIPSDTAVSADELSTFQVTWTDMSSLGVDYYKVYLYKSTELVAEYTVETNSINYTTISEKFDLVNGQYTIWVIPHWGGYWDVSGIGSSATFSIDTEEPTIEFLLEDSDIFTGQNDTAGGNITLCFEVNGTYSDVNTSSLEITITNETDGVWANDTDYRVDSVSWAQTGTNLYDLTIVLTILNGTEGKYTVWINVTDEAGNYYNSSDAYFIVDQSPPEASIDVENIDAGAAHVEVVITDNYEDYGSIDVSTLVIKRGGTTIVQYSSGEIVSLDSYVKDLAVGSDGLTIEFYDYNVSHGSTPSYQVSVSDFARNIHLATNNTTIDDNEFPDVDGPTIEVPVGEGDVKIPLTDYLPVGQDVAFSFVVHDEHIKYFNVSFAIAGDRAGVVVEFLNDPTTSASLVEGTDYTATITPGAYYLTIDTVTVERKDDFSYYVNVTINIDASAMYTQSDLAVTWEAKDYADNNGPSATGLATYHISAQTISISNLTATSLPGGDISLTWKIPTGFENYTGYVVYMYNGAAWTYVTHDFDTTATSVVIENATIETILHITPPDEVQNIQFRVYAVTKDAHYSYTEITNAIYDSKPPVITFDGTYAYNAAVSTDGDILYLNFTVTDGGTGVNFNGTSFDASEISTNVTLTVNETYGWVNVTVVLNKGATGEFNITLIVPDKAGNEGVWTNTVLVDNEAPEVAWYSTSEKVAAGETIELQLNVTDWPSHPAKINVSIGESYNKTDISSYTSGRPNYWNGTLNLTAPTTAGVYDIVVYLEDALGNNATITIGTIEVTPYEPEELKINLVELNGEPTEFTEGAPYYVVSIGDVFKLKATIYDAYDNALSPENVKLKWKIVLRNESGAVRAAEIPELGDWSIFEALAYGPVEIEAHLLSYTNPVTGQTVELTEGQVSGRVFIYIVPEVNKVVISGPEALTVGENATLTITAYYNETEGKFVNYLNVSSFEVEVPYAPITLEAIYGTLENTEITTGVDGTVAVLYTAPEYIGTYKVDETVTAYYAGNEVGSTTFEIRAGEPTKIVLAYTPEPALVTEEVTVTVEVYDEFGNPAYGEHVLTITTSEHIIAPTDITYVNGTETTFHIWPIEAGTAWINVTYGSVYANLTVEIQPLPDKAEILGVPEEVEAYNIYDVTVLVYNAAYGPISGAEVTLKEITDSTVRVIDDNVTTDAEGKATFSYSPSLFDEDTSAELVAEVYVNGTLILTTHIEFTIKAYYPYVVIEEVSEPTPVTGSAIMPGVPFYIDLTLKSYTPLPANITVYISIYRTGTGLEGGEWSITTAYVQLQPNEEKTIRIPILLPPTMPAGEYTMVITLHDWDRFVELGPVGSVLPFEDSRVVLTFTVVPFTEETAAADVSLIRFLL